MALRFCQTRPGRSSFLARDILEYNLDNRIKTLVRFPTEESMLQFDEWLWATKPDSFLAHGTSKDPYPERQPVYLSCSSENPNQATFLMLMAGATAQLGEITLFSETAILFDQNHADTCREFWKTLTAGGLKPVLQQHN